MRNSRRAIGPVPVTIPPDAIEDEDEEFVPFRLDRNDPDQIALAEVVGWERLEEMDEEAREAEAQEEMETYESPVAESNPKAWGMPDEE